jgi:hypothetical protein
LAIAQTIAPIALISFWANLGEGNGQDAFRCWRRRFFVWAIFFAFFAQFGKKRVSGIEPVCFRLEQFAGDCAEIVQNCAICAGIHLEFLG